MLRSRLQAAYNIALLYYTTWLPAASAYNQADTFFVVLHGRHNAGGQYTPSVVGRAKETLCPKGPHRLPDLSVSARSSDLVLVICAVFRVDLFLKFRMEAPGESNAMRHILSVKDAL